MNPQAQRQFKRIESAIDFIQSQFRHQPSLDEIAAAVHVSPHHFQRLFTEWAGVSPKKFMQYISLEHAKQLLENRMTVLQAAQQTGLSGTGRLHDLFVRIEGMTPGEFKSGGANLTIRYSFADTPFGTVIVASTSKGVCHLFFEDDETDALNGLTRRFPNARFQRLTDPFQQDALLIFRKDWRQLDQIKLHLSGTPFQVKVWESLLKIPQGALTTYGEIANDIGNPGAARAVGSAIGSNPVAFLIPCHRVIQRGGGIGGYRWGTQRKTAMIGWESSQSAAAPE
ncbi:MAG: methylated-DNA--[protein]-cysteine S-methyltransferase [Gammaproteobacteria bacterium]